MATDMVGVRVDPGKVSADRKPTSRQIWAAARLAFELLGLEWPEDRRAMSAAIGRLQVAQSEASSADSADSCPF
jgi:hypothetical protein